MYLDHYLDKESQKVSLWGDKSQDKVSSYTDYKNMIDVLEGKNREIRKIMASFNLKVLRLVRHKFGPFDLGDLSIGKFQKLKIEMYPFLRKLILQK